MVLRALGGAATVWMEGDSMTPCVLRSVAPQNIPLKWPLLRGLFVLQ
jgi:hypothetical protein